MGKALDSDIERLCDLLKDQRRVLIRRAAIAWERSPETFGAEIIALNDVEEALRNIRSRFQP